MLDAHQPSMLLQNPFGFAAQLPFYLLGVIVIVMLIIVFNSLDIKTRSPKELFLISNWYVSILNGCIFNAPTVQLHVLFSIVFCKESDPLIVVFVNVVVTKTDAAPV